MALKVPPLRERPGDVLTLAKFFLERASARCRRRVKGISEEAERYLAAYGWPGNVRELENAMGNACMMTDGDIVDVRDLPPYLLGDQDNCRLSLAGGELLPLAEVERRYAQQALRQLGGNKAKTAEALGISRATLYRILNDQVVADIKALDPSPWDV